MGSAFLVNAEVDSMGGVVEGRVGFTKTSPRRAAIEKVQAELRQEYDVREERRRELEFLDKGGNPLDIKFGNAGSVSFQSTSLTDQHPDQFVTSEAKGSFTLTASPHGDSIESSGRRGAFEPNTADNLMLFDGENESLNGKRNSGYPSMNNMALQGHLSQVDSFQNANALGHSAAFGIPKKAYKRRPRSRTNRDGTRSSSTDVVLSREGHASSFPTYPGPRDAKGSVSTSEIQRDLKIPLNCSSQLTSPIGGIIGKAVSLDSQKDMELNDATSKDSTTNPVENGLQIAVPDASTYENMSNQPILQPAQKPSIQMASRGDGPLEGIEEENVESVEPQQLPDTAYAEKQDIPCQMNGCSSMKGGGISTLDDGQDKNAALLPKGVDSDSSYTHFSRSLDGINNGQMHGDLKSIDSNGITKAQYFVTEGTLVQESEEGKEKKVANAGDNCTHITDDYNFVDKSVQANGFAFQGREPLSGNGSGSQSEVKNEIIVKGTVSVPAGESESQKMPSLSCSSNPLNENVCNVGDRVLAGSSISELQETRSSGGVSNVTLPPNSKSTIKVDEDAVLEEAQIIEAKHKRIAELSVSIPREEKCRKSHWDYVLEEVAWLANDFSQERLWKITAAAQICRRAAFASQMKIQRQKLHWEQKKVSCVLAKAVMEFWHQAEEACKKLDGGFQEKDSSYAVVNYAVRFLTNSSLDSQSVAEAPVTPDRISDPGTLDEGWHDHLTEEILFYAVPHGAIETYRKSVESHVLQLRNNCGLMQGGETSGFDAAADFRSRYNMHEDDEGETSTYSVSAFEGSKSSRFVHKHRNNLPNAYGARSYDVGADTEFMQSMENKDATVSIGKRPLTSLNTSIPTKRHRTASRHRVLGPFNVGTSGSIQTPIKTDASSGDTNSLQDDHSTLHGGSHMPNNFEVESTGEFENQSPYDFGEVSTKPNKKRKAKHLAAYKQKWQAESNYQNEQKDLSKRRSEGHQLESNGNSGLYGQNMSKKLKIVRQPLENSLDNMTQVGGVIPSPVASQTSNMPNPNKVMKVIVGRDRVRKSKGLKLPAGLSGSGNAWSLFEDQALVVLVHDMGPNWELVSDAINNTLQLKCIYRNPKECMERHRMLMDRTTGDGADSADDSGSSQSYRSTLPGIPKGSARQLFQRLQGPLEEDMLKSHFEKIIMISQKHHYRRTQTDNHDRKQIQQAHGSHMLSLSQVSPNNLNGGPILTPLDLCDVTTSSPDSALFGYQGPQTIGVAMSNQGNLAPVIPSSGVNSPVQGPSSMIPGNNFSMSSRPPNASARDGRYAPRSTSLSVDGQQRMQQYNQMLSGRNIQHSNLSSPGADRGGVRVIPGGGGVGVLPGINRNIPMARPGFQGIVSSSMLSGDIAGPNAMGPGQGASILQPREGLHMVRPNHVQEPQRQMTPEQQMQVSQGNSQGLPTLGGISSSFPHSTASTPVPSYPLHHSQSHSMTSQQQHMLNPRIHLQGANRATNLQQQTYANRLAKDRHLQQRFLQQQQQQFAMSNSLMPHVQSQPHIPISSSLQNSSQIPSQTTSQALSVSASASTPGTSMSQQQQQLKHSIPPHGIARSAQTSNATQMGKQRNRQPQQNQQLEQAGRLHPQQRHQSQSQQQAKILKGVGRGNMTHQKSHMDPSLLNGLAASPNNPSGEKGDQALHFLQPQGLYSGSTVNPVQPVKPPMPPHSLSHSQPQQKMYSNQVSPSTQHPSQMSSHIDSNNQACVSTVTSGATLSSHHQSVKPLSIGSSSHQTQQPHLQQVPPLPNSLNRNPPIQRVLHHGHQVNMDPSNKTQDSDAQSEHHHMLSSPQTDTMMSMSQEYNTTNVTEVVSPSSAPLRHVAEPLIDSVRIPSTNSAGGEPTAELANA